MSKPLSKSTKTGRRGENRHARQETVGYLIQYLQNAGPDVIHTVRSIATVMYGDDSILETRQISAARRMIDEIQKLQLPLEPCDETGLLISKAAAKARARRGKAGCWRYIPTASALGEAMLEGMGDKPMVTVAIAVLTLESASLPSRSGGPEVKAFFDAVRGWIPRSAFAEAATELARRMPKHGGW